MGYTKKKESYGSTHSSVPNLPVTPTLCPSSAMDALPEHIPLLPEHPNHDVWSANALEAHGILLSSYNHGLHALRASDNDAHQLQIHSDHILNQMLPILEALEGEMLDFGWV